ncbi:glycosyltransferase family 2 protein [Microbacterium sp. zg.Y625]|uniref:glycosyltransferase family 2 protein n=1 Tax=Microbacterium jiangjiandongii TaxID=3049071 RepID=UPI00214AF5D0|nr:MULTISPECIES: glycosyltransferase family 2 protein [unclassified Microbacterium]MCR2793531.1 glycosyltransferase family 2 protein [Microbacterium sp. zg.Y625]WIM25885.1 glycosyltransferase family 2 protein [Microbacterium sp. zg-Y625]
MSFQRIAVVMPAYNEAAGIAEFLLEIHEHLAPLASELDIVVADDRSTDATAAVVAGLGLDRVQVQTQTRNRGHGPTALAAYVAGLQLSPDVVVHVDGDGQFAGNDIARVLGALEATGADVVHGVRRGREDPWFRRALSFGLRVAVRPFAGRGVPDINTPLRAYRPQVLQQLIDAVGADAIVPHVHFSLAEARCGLRVTSVPVRSLPRRGGETVGTMWGGNGQPKLPPKRLRSFVRHALGELWRLSLRPSAPMLALRTASADLRSRVADAA